MCILAHCDPAPVLTLVYDYDLLFCRIDADGTGLITLEELGVRTYYYLDTR